MDKTLDTYFDLQWKNILNEQFHPTDLNQVWVSGVHSHCGYLSPDRYERKYLDRMEKSDQKLAG